MEPSEYTALSKKLAGIIVSAYGKTPDAWDDLEEQTLSAFTFGAHRSFSVDAGVAEWQCRIAMTEIFMDVFGFSDEMACSALDYLTECLEKPETDAVVNLLIHSGDHGLGLLSEPEELGRQLRELVYVLGQKLQEG